MADQTDPHPYLPKLRQQFAEGRVSRREFLRTATLLGLSAGAAYAFAGVPGGARNAHAAEGPLPKGGTCKVGMQVQDLSTPHAYASLQSDITRQVCQYLTRTDQDNVTRPLLLRDWQVSEDLRTWTLNLRRGVKWHDGRAFTADDVVWNLQHLLDPETGSSTLGLMKSYMLNEVETDDGGTTTELWDANAIEKLDDHTVRLNLKEPQLAVPEHLFHYPNHMLDPAEGGQFGPGSNGTGPFRLVEAEVGVRAVLEAYDDYWGEGPHLDRLEIIDLGGDTSAQLAALESKQIDILRDMNIGLIESVERMEHATFQSTPSGQTAVARVQVDKPPFDDPRVRKAMRLAIDTPKVLEIAHRGEGLAGEHHHVCPIHPEYADVGSMPQDLERAKALLSEAGYPDGLDLEIACKTSPAWELDAVQAMQQMWRQAGIRVTINSMPASSYWDIWTQVPFGFTDWAHRPLGIMALSLAYKSGGNWNETNYANPEFDRLLSKAEGIADPEARSEVMAEIERILQEDGPIVQPVWRAVFAAHNKRVKGFRLHPVMFFFGEELAVES
jgi:peptide/nickel transport system substrate-binding protein